jgi:hypothetical protein
MKLMLVAVMALAMSAVSCKNSKKTTDSTDTNIKVEKTTQAPDGNSDRKEVAAKPQEVKQEAKAERPAPKYPDSLFFRIERTPCFGQCPTYTVNIYSSGWALMEGKQFFDYTGFYTTKFSESELIQIEKLAMMNGFPKMDHVYDAPVTDLPSTTTIVQSENINHWVYNRMNSPDELRTFEREMETRIKDKQWKPYTKNGVPKGE